jgi:hypothetical protein
VPSTKTIDSAWGLAERRQGGDALDYQDNMFVFLN